MLSVAGAYERDLSSCSSSLIAREVLELVAEGRSNRAIAETLFIAERTVESHIQHVFDKLGLPDDRSTNRRVLVIPSDSGGFRWIQALETC